MLERKRLRIEALEERRLLSAIPVLDLNGVAPGVNFALERADGKGLVALVSHDMLVDGGGAAQLASATVRISAPQTGDTVGALTHGTNISASFANGQLNLTGIDSVANYQQVLRTARFNSTATRTVGSQIDVSFVVTDGVQTSEPVHSVITVISPGTSSVVGRYLFYNNSSFDGASAVANAGDDLAIASDKQALRHGQQATVSNYSSYLRGINGIMIDIAGSHGAITSNDFILQVGNNSFPDTWLNAPAPVSVTTRAGAGVGGSDRVELIWADSAITNQWLQVVVAANSRTGLGSPDTFLFGNRIGESGNSATDARVTTIDLLRVKNRLLLGQIEAPPDDSLDYTRDGRINTLDLLVAKNQILTATPELSLVNVAPIATERLNTTVSTGVISTIYPDPPLSDVRQFWQYEPPIVGGYPLDYIASVSVRPTTMTIPFRYLVGVEGGVDGAHSASNPHNYQLYKDGIEQPGAIASAEVTVANDGAPPTESSVVLSFDRPLESGQYRVVARGTIHTTASQPIDGQGDGTPGGDYVRDFSVAPIIRGGDASVIARSDDPAGGVMTPVVASTPSGEFVVAWSKQDYFNSEFHLFVQRLSASHVPLGEPQLVSTHANPRDLSLAVDAGGTVTVAWSTQPNYPGYAKPILSEPGDVFARRLAPDLTPLGDPFQVDAPSPLVHQPGFSALDPALAVNGRGDTVITWVKESDELVARLYDSAGRPRGDAFSYAIEEASIFHDLYSPRVAMDALGRFVAVWAVSNLERPDRLVGRLFDADGQPRGAEFVLYEATTLDPIESPSIAMSEQGDFAVAWQSSTPWISEILVRRFDADGRPHGEPTSVDKQYYPWTASNPQVSLTEEGAFVVSWRTDRVKTGGYLWYDPEVLPKSLYFARVYDSAGVTADAPALVTSDQFARLTTIDNYLGPYVASASLAVNRQGKAMMVWTQGLAEHWSLYESQDSLLAQTWDLDLAAS